MKMNKISVIGLGYIGLPTSILLAQHNMGVIGIDTNETVVYSVNHCKLHIYEAGLEQHLKQAVSSGLLRASLVPEPADIFLLTVPTPCDDMHRANISFIKNATHAIAPVLKKGNLVILESTSPVGTTEKVAELLAELRPDLRFPQHEPLSIDVHIAYCPERVLPGNILQELVENDRVIGGLTPECSKLAKSFYKTFVSGECHLTSARTAEMCKLTENSFRDVNIAFANELSMICETLGIDVHEMIGLANRHPRVNILQPSCGVGGHCLAVDPWFIVEKAPDKAHLIRTARIVNDSKAEWELEKIKAAVYNVLANAPSKKIDEVVVVCLGLAYKPNSDDLRNSPALYIVKKLAQLGCQVFVIEPHINQLPAALSLKNVQLVELDTTLKLADVVSKLVKHECFKDF